VRRVFVDTSAFFAHLIAEDAHYSEARALFERADREAWTLITTNAVVWETYTLIRIRARNGREPRERR
jgi:predicted nucleic acid-binding protein